MPDNPHPDTGPEAALRNADAARERGDLGLALALYSDALTLDGRNTYAWYWMATCCEDKGDFDLANDHCNAGLDIDPDQLGLLLRKASIAVASKNHHAALACYLRAAELDPEIPDIDALIADQYCFLGNPELGRRYFERAVRANPGSARLQSNRLFVLSYGSELTPDEVFSLHAQWGRSVEDAVRPERRAHSNSRIPDRRLRIGYVSGDLRSHAVAFFVEPLLKHHDKEDFDVFCFDTSSMAEDEVTSTLKAHRVLWRRVMDLSDADFAAAVRNDEIDILIDLSGHTTMNRLPVFARKPAPVQATWLGYLSTTGLSTMDYRITDAYLDPPGMTERYHTEDLFRLRNSACFAPPCGERGHALPAGQRHQEFTFGSVNQWSKVTPSVRRVWATLLCAIPESRLLIVARGANTMDFDQSVRKEMAQLGVDASRLDLRPTTNLRDFLQLFDQIDVALDPFPYGGGTTTFQSLCRGVPVITLAGHNAFARNAVGPLVETGLDDYIAQSTEEYVAIAKRTAGNRETLRRLRHDLPGRIATSALLDQPRFARAFEAGLREMWHRYCAGGPKVRR